MSQPSVNQLLSTDVVLDDGRVLHPHKMTVSQPLKVLDDLRRESFFVKENIEEADDKSVTLGSRDTEPVLKSARRD